MAVANTTAVALSGIEGEVVTVEAALAPGLPGTTVIGMGDAAVGQAKERVRSALLNSGEKWPEKRITLALSPAALPKRGAAFDLALAVAVLQAAEEVPVASTVGVVLIGELGLDGSVRAVHGVLPSMLAVARISCRVVIVPEANLAEAALVGTAPVLGARSLADVLVHLRGKGTPLSSPPAGRPVRVENGPDMKDVLGQPEARAALEVAAAGGHHLAMIGPPGAGKTMLAARLPGLLPPLTREEAIEVTAVHSVGGMLLDGDPLICRAPFVDPHHSASLAAVVGGGSKVIRPGSISMAHRGVLFLDEAPEFKGSVLDSLRQPMESGEVMIVRSVGSVRYPARFQLVLAANPCPCAAARDIDCVCPSGARRRYLGRLSGPLLDRVDIRVDLPALDPAALAGRVEGESSAVIRGRVVTARERAVRRWGDAPWSSNAEVPGPVVRRCWRPDPPEAALLERAVRSGQLTGRGYDRVLRLALTCADLAGREVPVFSDVAMALGLRSVEAS
ncbi:ATP-binding protein [Nakamurella silvestris]|nr:ATP-binding protein [Nakamurella silvestris]